MKDLTNLAVAAVTTPPFWKTGESLPSDSTVVEGRGCSSWAKMMSPFRDLRVMGVISSAKAPASTPALRFVRQRPFAVDQGLKRSRKERVENGNARLTGFPSLLRLNSVSITVLPSDVVHLRQVLSGDSHRGRVRNPISQSSGQRILHLQIDTVLVSKPRRNPRQNVYRIID